MSAQHYAVVSEFGYYGSPTPTFWLPFSGCSVFPCLFCTEIVASQTALIDSYLLNSLHGVEKISSSWPSGTANLSGRSTFTHIEVSKQHSSGSLEILKDKQSLSIDAPNDQKGTFCTECIKTSLTSCCGTRLHVESVNAATAWLRFVNPNIVELWGSVQFLSVMSLFCAENSIPYAVRDTSLFSLLQMVAIIGDGTNADIVRSLTATVATIIRNASSVICSTDEIAVHIQGYFQVPPSRTIINTLPSLSEHLLSESITKSLVPPSLNSRDILISPKLKRSESKIPECRRNPPDSQSAPTTIIHIANLHDSHLLAEVLCATGSCVPAPRVRISSFVDTLHMSDFIIDSDDSDLKYQSRCIFDLSVKILGHSLKTFAEAIGSIQFLFEECDGQYSLEPRRQIENVSREDTFVDVFLAGKDSMNELAVNVSSFTSVVVIIDIAMTRELLDYVEELAEVLFKYLRLQTLVIIIHVKKDDQHLKTKITTPVVCAPCRVSGGRSHFLWFAGSLPNDFNSSQKVAPKVLLENSCRTTTDWQIFVGSLIEQFILSSDTRISRILFDHSLLETQKTIAIALLDLARSIFNLPSQICGLVSNLENNTPVVELESLSMGTYYDSVIVACYPNERVVQSDLFNSFAFPISIPLSMTSIAAGPSYSSHTTLQNSGSGNFRFTFATNSENSSASMSKALELILLRNTAGTLQLRQLIISKTSLTLLTNNHFGDSTETLTETWDAKSDLGMCRTLLHQIAITSDAIFYPNARDADVTPDSAHILTKLRAFSEYEGCINIDFEETRQDVDMIRCTFQGEVMSLGITLQNLQNSLGSIRGDQAARKAKNYTARQLQLESIIPTIKCAFRI